MIPSVTFLIIVYERTIHMKRIILLPLLILPLLLSSCGEPPKADGDFTAAFTAVKGDEEYAGTVTRSNGNTTVTLSDPYTVNGITCQTDEGRFKLELGNCSATVDSDHLPSDSLPRFLCGSLNNLSLATYVESQEDTDRFILPTDLGNADLTTKGGKISSLEDEHSGWQISFSPKTDPSASTSTTHDASAPTP